MSNTGDKLLKKEARALCYKARDEFYQCVREQAGYVFTQETEIPLKCRKLRVAFEKSCPASWVQHFDAQQDAAARRTRQIYNNIQQQSTNAAGTLAGKAQR